MKICLWNIHKIILSECTEIDSTAQLHPGKFKTQMSSCNSHTQWLISTSLKICIKRRY